MPFSLPALPYAKDALQPHMSAETFEFHHGKHHNAYVTKLNDLTAGKPQANLRLEDIIKTSRGVLFNQAAQAWNHSFFWNCMTPGGGGNPAGDLADAMNRDFGGLDGFKTAFRTAAGGHFGSGWAWLVNDGGTLAVTTTADADTPIRGNAKPLLVLDVWEHAYYIDYRNGRAKYIDAFLEHLVNWDFAASQL